MKSIINERWECDECHKKFKELRWRKGKKLCYACIHKEWNIISVAKPMKFEEPLICQATLNICLTNLQWTEFEKRIKFLNITKTEYVRQLVLWDLKNSKEKK